MERMNGRVYLVSFLLAATPFGQSSPPEPYAFLQKHLAFSAAELIALERGQTIVRLPKTVETREVAAFAIMRLDVPQEFFLEKMRDIVNFKKSDNVLQIGKFSNPPRAEDLAGLTLDPAEIDSIRRCRVNSCDLKLSAQAIERFRKQINWAAPDFRERVSALQREILLEYVNAYWKGGNGSLGEYNDRSYPVRLADEFRPLIQPAPYMYEYGPEFQKYLESFPNFRPAGVEDFIYWSKEKFGLKPVVSVTHISVYKVQHANGSDVLIASKGIYANHYFETSLGLTCFIQSQSSQPARTYLIYINRSKTDALRGLLGGLKRSLIGGSLRDGAKNNMDMIKKKLETAYRK